jgi:hypothetical protein
MAAPPKPSLDLSIVIHAPAGRVLKAFFETGALGAWWSVSHAVTAPRPFGPYVIEWAPTTFSDEVLGRLGGVFRGTVIQFEPEEGFFVADAYWLPPDGDPIGPMAFEVVCTPAGQEAGAGTHVRVKQSGFEEGPRWRRYYEVVGPGLTRALQSLKALLEK